MASLPGVLQLSCGANFTSRGREFTHALTVHLADKAALDAYATHPGKRRALARGARLRARARSRVFLPRSHDTHIPLRAAPAEHLRVLSESLAPIRASVLAVDYETD